jgi:hypothetical protein
MSIRLDPSVTETRTRKAYWDNSALDQTFGEDRVDTYWEETRGHGSLHKGPDGEFYHEDFHGERQRADDKVFADLLSGDETDGD